MAETKKRRKGKKRGTQGGRVDDKPRGGRPRSREEAKARARAKKGKAPAQRADAPPTWRSAATRGIFAAVIFFVLLLLLFKRPLGVAAAFAGFMLAFYVPAGYYIDMAMWRRRERARIRAREQARGQR